MGVRLLDAFASGALNAQTLIEGATLNCDFPCTKNKDGLTRRKHSVQRRPARVLTSTHTASTRMLPFTIICQ